MPPTIRRATAADADLVPGILARAFDDDPWVNFLAKQDARRGQRILWSFQRAFARSLEVGEAYVADDGSGVALWFPIAEPPRDRLTALRERLYMLRWTAPLSGISRVLTASRARARVVAAHPAQAHWELRLLGVEPDRQRAGVASALVRPVLQRLAAEGHLIALTCTKARNLPMYQHLGFEVTGEVRVSDDVRVWVMQRPPHVP